MLANGKKATVEFFGVVLATQCKVLRKQLTQPNATMPMPQRLHSTALLGVLRRRFVCVVGIVLGADRASSCRRYLLRDLSLAGKTRAGVCGGVAESRQVKPTNRQKSESKH